MAREAGGSEAPILNVRGERVALGPLRRDLLDVYGRWIDDLHTARNLDAPPRPMTAEQEESWYDSQARAASDAPFTIYALPELEPIGDAGLHGIDHRNRSATFGIVIGEESYRGGGYGTETTRLVLDYAFNTLSLHNVMLSVFAYNRAAPTRRRASRRSDAAENAGQ